jgi:hypothetical protein
MTPPKVKPLLVAAMILIIVATPVAYAEKCKYEENRTDFIMDFTDVDGSPVKVALRKLKPLAKEFPK